MNSEIVQLQGTGNGNYCSSKKDQEMAHDSTLDGRIYKEQDSSDYVSCHLVIEEDILDFEDEKYDISDNFVAGDNKSDEKDAKTAEHYEEFVAISNAPLKSEGNQRVEKMQPEKADGSSNLWISGISYNTKAKDLFPVFSKFGQVIGAKILANSKEGRPKCFAFVTMGSSSEAATCIKNQSVMNVLGEKITIKLAQSSLNISSTKGLAEVNSKGKMTENSKGRHSDPKNCIENVSNFDKATLTRSCKSIDSPKLEMPIEYDLRLKLNESKSSLKNTSSEQNSSSQLPDSQIVGQDSLGIRQDSHQSLSPKRQRSPRHHSQTRLRSPVRESLSKQRSPLKRSPLRKRTPLRRSPFRRRSPLRRSPLRKRSPFRRSPARGRSPARERSLTRYRSPTRRSPINERIPVKISSYSQGGSYRRSPASQRSPRRGSPARKSRGSQRSPLRRSPIRARSPLRRSPIRGRSPLRRSPVRRRSPLRRSPVRARSPMRRSPMRQRSPMRGSPVRARSPLRRSPVRPRSPLRRSPMRQSSPMRRSPMRQSSPMRRSPMRQRSPMRRSPVRPRSPLRRSPMRQSSPMRRSPMRQRSPIRRSPMRQSSPMRRSPMRQRSPIRRSPMRQRSPMRRSPMRQRSPTRRSPMRQISPMRRSPIRQSSPLRRSPLRQGRPLRRSPARPRSLSGRSPIRRRSSSIGSPINHRTPPRRSPPNSISARPGSPSWRAPYSQRSSHYILQNRERSPIQRSSFSPPIQHKISQPLLQNELRSPPSLGYIDHHKSSKLDQKVYYPISARSQNSPLGSSIRSPSSYHSPTERLNLKNSHRSSMEKDYLQPASYKQPNHLEHEHDEDLMYRKARHSHDFESLDRRQPDDARFHLTSSRQRDPLEELSHKSQSSKNDFNPKIDTSSGFLVDKVLKGPQTAKPFSREEYKKYEENLSSTERLTDDVRNFRREFQDIESQGTKKENSIRERYSLVHEVFDSSKKYTDNEISAHIFKEQRDFVAPKSGTVQSNDSTFHTINPFESISPAAKQNITLPSNYPTEKLENKMKTSLIRPSVEKPSSNQDTKSERFAGLRDPWALSKPSNNQRSGSEIFNERIQSQTTCNSRMMMNTFNEPLASAMPSGSFRTINPFYNPDAGNQF